MHILFSSEAVLLLLFWFGSTKSETQVLLIQCSAVSGLVVQFLPKIPTMYTGLRQKNAFLICKSQTNSYFSLRCSAQEIFWLETASQTWRTKSFNRFQGPLTVERITTGQFRILKEGFHYKAICFFCVRFKESEGLEQTNWRRKANTLSQKSQTNSASN